ncbi:MAG: hypothetical protein JWM87_786 [Candidatus Eremiobacteraeota bacterium]|nr:hypothetical protein [Candidatus Eremiobacteraeota bacterium]
MRERVVTIIESERGWLDLGDVAIGVQISDLSKHGTDTYGATFGSPEENGCEALIFIDPRAFTHEAGIEHIVRHELVHVAHGVRFGEDREAALEWLVDEIARIAHENRTIRDDVAAAKALLEREGYRVQPPPCALCRGSGFVNEPISVDNFGTYGITSKPCPRGCRASQTVFIPNVRSRPLDARAAGARPHPL